MRIPAQLYSHPLAKRLRLWMALIVILMLPACSSLEFAYSFVDDVIEGRAETYLDLNEEEKDKVSEQTNALVAWHRSEMLPKYATFFSAQADVAEQGGWSRPQLSLAFQEFRRLLNATADGAAPFFAAVLVDHSSPEKRAYLQKQLAENLSEKREEASEMSEEERIEEWVERREERIERFTGPLRDDQIDIIRRITASGMDHAGRWYDHRELRQEALIDFLATNPSEEDLAPVIAKLLVRAHEVVDPAYEARSNARWAKREDMYFLVLETLSDEQRAKLVTTLRGYAEDLVSLAQS